MQLILPLLIRLPIIGAFCIILISKRQSALDYRRKISLWVTAFCLPLSSLLWVFFDKSTGDFQYTINYSWTQNYNLSISLGIDGISLFFILLTTLLIPICILASWYTIKEQAPLYYRAFLIINRFVIAVFCVTDLLVFYIFFEAVLIPIFLLIGIYGGRERRMKAAYLFFLYTLLGSLLILLAILFLYLSVGTTDYYILQEASLRVERERLLWLAFFCSFAVKVPILPVHLWLPEAHVEAPTAGSVFLAGILLKLGTYGIIRFSFGLFPEASIYFCPLVQLLAILAVVYTSCTALRQRDIKRVIAYASVAHINITIVGIFSFTSEGLIGSIFQMLSHGVVSGALFLCVGVLYDRYHTRIIRYYRGVAFPMPIYIRFFLLFTLRNIAFPGTSRFVGEFLILLGVYQTNLFVIVIVARSIVLGGAYSLWLFNRLAYGSLRYPLLVAGRAVASDLTRREFLLFLPLAILTILIGIYPRPFLDPIYRRCQNLLILFNF